MRAAILTTICGPLEMVDLKCESRLAFGQVRVKLEYSGICGAQLGEIDGAKGPDKFLPHCLGHEGVGEVLDIGEGVKTVSVGDTVVLHWRPSDGLQSEPPKYWVNKGPVQWDYNVNAGWVTTFQEQAIVSENRVTKLPGDIDHKVAPLFGCALTTAYGVITRDANVKPGQSVLVFGAGGVGLAIIQMAVLAGAYPVVAIDPVAIKMDAAVKRGARAWEMSDEYFDVAIDTTGKSQIIQEAYFHTEKQGKTILVGVPRHDDPITIPSLPLHFGKVLTGSHGGDAVPHEDIPRLAKLVNAGLLDLDGLVTHEFPLEQVNDAIELVRSGDAGRVLLRMSQ